jgi:hypothetical protein
VGFVAGYREIQKGNKHAKHIIVNGAFDPDNSGGPLLVTQGNKVIGIAATTYHFFPEYLEAWRPQSRLWKRLEAECQLDNFR